MMISDKLLSISLFILVGGDLWDSGPHYADDTLYSFYCIWESKQTPSRKH